MLKNYFKTAFRNLWKNKASSLINILGLTIGLSCCLLIGLYIQHEISYDNFEKNGDRVARVLKDSVINRNITFKIEKGSPRLKYYVQGYLTVGKLSVTFTNPEGQDGGAFQLETGRNKGDGKRSAKGTLSHSKTDPMPGTWVMNISVEGGTGDLSYQIYPEKP